MAFFILENQPGRALKPPLDRGVERLFLFILRIAQDREVGLRTRPEKHQQGRVAAVIEDHVGSAAVGPFEDAVGEVPILLQRLALVRKDRDAARRDRRGRLILGGEDVARGPAHLRPKGDQRLDQDRRLDRHVERARDPRALQRLRLAELLADRHQPRHLGLGDQNLGPAPIGKADVLDGEITGNVVQLGPFGHSAGAHDFPWPWASIFGTRGR